MNSPNFLEGPDVRLNPLLTSVAQPDYIPPREREEEKRKDGAAWLLVPLLCLAVRREHHGAIMGVEVIGWRQRWIDHLSAVRWNGEWKPHPAGANAASSSATARKQVANLLGVTAVNK